jgi:hypothetical protein
MTLRSLLETLIHIAGYAIIAYVVVDAAVKTGVLLWARIQEADRVRCRVCQRELTGYHEVHGFDGSGKTSDAGVCDACVLPEAEARAIYATMQYHSRSMRDAAWSDEISRRRSPLRRLNNEQLEKLWRDVIDGSMGR